MLILPIKKQWFDMIAKGEKADEYREIKPYYTKRFENLGLINEDGELTDKQVMIGLRNGYSKDAPTLIVTVSLSVNKGLKQWGAVEGVLYYVLEIIRRHSIYVGNEEFYRYR